MSSNNIHDEWVSLVEVSGPFLASPVLNEAFPQGLDLLDPAKRKRLRQTYEEWREALEAEDPEFAKLHQAWVKEVISNCLGYDEDSKGTHLKFGAAIPPTLAVQIPEQGVTLAPEFVLVDEQHDNKPLLLIQSYASGLDLQAAMSIDGWELFRMARENNHPPDEQSAAELLTAAVLAAEERREGVIDLGIVKRALWLLMGQDAP